MIKYCKLISLYIILIIQLLLMDHLFAQHLIKGQVVSADLKQPVIGAMIFCLQADEPVFSDSAGFFQINLKNGGFPLSLIVSSLSFKTDTIMVNELKSDLVIYMKDQKSLNEVQVVSNRRSTEISTLQIHNAENINEGELLKAACCNLSESFETNPTVDVNYKDGITGSKEIQLLGLSGIYTQLMTENVPGNRGLAVPFGLTYYPGPWIQSIQISKGKGAVANGYESISGQINIELKDPVKSPSHFINLFADNDGRYELNSIHTHKLKNGSRHQLFLNGNINNQKNDHNKDGFLDQPRWKQFNMLDRWFFRRGKHFEAQFSTKFTYDDKKGGQFSYTSSEPVSKDNGYAVLILTKRLELVSKTGWVFPETPWKSIGWQNAWIYHDQSSVIGLRTYNGKQHSYYSNLAYQTIIGSTNQKIKSGIDFKADFFNESFNDSSFNIRELVPGIYSEYTFNPEHKKVGIVAGMRIDYHNLFGIIYSPAFNFKYNLTDRIIFRLSAGKGSRTPHAVPDNLGLMASGRIFKILEKPELENAWNAGTNFTWSFNIFNHESSLNLDFYRTEFINQYVVDLYTDPRYINFYNLKGKSSSTTFQAIYFVEVFHNLEMRIAYKVIDAKCDYAEQNNLPKPLVSRNKALINLSYKTPREHWRFDCTLLWDGKKPIQPFSGDMPTSQSNISWSQPYFQLMAQVTKVFKKWEVYIGGENLLNYTQNYPVINAQQPFSGNFDATRIWGPLMDRKLYSGVRLTIN